MIKKPEKFWRTWAVGGDPDELEMLGWKLDDTLQTMQSKGWIIVSIDKIDIGSAWSTRQQKSVSCVQYIIIAYYKTTEDDS